MSALAWTVKLHKMNTRLTNKANTLLDVLPHSAVSSSPKKLTELRKNLLAYVKGVTWREKKGETASRLLIFMVSNEQSLENHVLFLSKHF